MRSKAATALTPVLPLGAWGATQVGIRYALKKDCEAVVTMDAVGQHESAFVSEMHALIASGQADVVIGSCPQRGSAARRSRGQRGDPFSFTFSFIGFATLTANQQVGGVVSCCGRLCYNCGN